MNRFFSLLIAPLAAGIVSASGEEASRTAPPLSAVVDLTHGYSFYTGFGTFLHHYLKPGQNGVNNWRSFQNLDLKDANVFLLPACDERVPYTEKDREVMREFAREGGGVVIVGHPGSGQQNAMGAEFGVRFAGEAKPPLSFTASSPVKEGLETEKSCTLTFTEGKEWKVLVADAEGQPVVAERALGKGRVLALPFSFTGARGKGAKGSVNDAWLSSLLADAGKGKKVDLTQKVDGGDLVRTDHSRKVGSLVYHWNDYLTPSAEAMVRMDTRCRPSIEKFMGVPLSPGMSGEVGLLSTDGGGYSNGRHIGLAVFWDGFPKREDSMIEFITHENVHSWVLPHAEPYWNEPIATYVGDLVMADQGHREEAERRIKGVIDAALKIDPEMKVYDLGGKGPEGSRALGPDEARAINWGKSFWVFEELRKRDPEFNAKYFQAKRKHVPATLPKPYSLDDAVAVMSIAAGEDLFPWFCAHGMPVDRSRVQAEIK